MAVFGTVIRFRRHNATNAGRVGTFQRDQQNLERYYELCHQELSNIDRDRVPKFDEHIKRMQRYFRGN